MNVAQFVSVWLILAQMMLMIALMANKTNEQWQWTVIIFVLSFVFAIVGCAVKVMRGES